MIAQTSSFMIRHDADELARWAGGRWLDDKLPGNVQGFTNDTRLLEPGQVFVALRDRRDGHDFVPQAAARGAVAALVDRPVAVDLPQLRVDDTLAALQSVAAHHRRRFAGKVAGITGSCGKTSTKDMLIRLLGEATIGTAGNYNNFIGVPLSLLRIDPHEHAFAAIEAGINRAGEMAVLADIIRPDVTLVTMIGPAHLEGLGSLERIAEEKSHLGRTAITHGGELVLPESCAQYSVYRDIGGDRVWWVRQDASGPRQVASGREVVYTASTLDADSTACCLHVRQSGFPEIGLTIPALGPGMTSNLVLALVTARLMGVADIYLQERIRNWSPARQRGETHRLGETLYYVDCYNASPPAVREAMFTFASRTQPGVPRLWVLGGMKELGAGSRKYHHETAAALPWREGDQLIAVGAESVWMVEGFRERHPDGVAVALLDPMDAAPMVRSFEGAVFLKGSRAYALERLLPECLQTGEGHGC